MYNYMYMYNIFNFKIKMVILPSLSMLSVIFCKKNSLDLNFGGYKLSMLGE